MNYLENRAAIWEWLAYVKLRGVGGDSDLAKAVENEARKIIHDLAQNVDKKELKDETRRIRERLKTEKSKRKNEIDIKFGDGGMLDIYFAVRFLQLRDNLPDADENRSTLFVLQKLFENKSLAAKDFKNFAEGYRFLAELDHNLRLVVGRSTRLPLANERALRIISERMKLASINELLENLTVHRLNIRAAFENVLL